jgi:transposase
LWVLGLEFKSFVVRATAPDVMPHGDEWGGYAWVAGMGRGHATVCHGAREGARDADGDGAREVHNNTREGLGTGLRNFLRPFRGVSKWFLDEYVGIFPWIHTINPVTGVFIRALLGRPITNLGP